MRRLMYEAGNACWSPPERAACQIDELWDAGSLMRGGMASGEYR